MNNSQIIASMKDNKIHMYNSQTLQRGIHNGLDYSNEIYTALELGSKLIACDEKKLCVLDLNSNMN